MKKISCLSVVLFTLLTLFSCTTGLGEAVDIEGPEVRVTKMVCIEPATADTPENIVEKTTFSTTIYTKKSVTFYGEATDNIGVTKVRVELKWLDSSDDYILVNNATLTGNTWESKVEFSREGACRLRFTAEDSKGNWDIVSEKVVNLFVDETAPVGDAWYIDRQVNGIQYDFKSLEELKAILEADPELTELTNIDVAQNGKFLICGTFTDATGIADGMTLSLFDEDGNKVVDNIGIDGEETSNNYVPKFAINGSALGLPESGKHFYEIRYSVADLVTDPKANSVTDKEIEMGWFLWWPESDNPKVSISEYKNGDISKTVSTGDRLNITVFDDDALAGTVKCVLNGKEKIESENEISSTTTRSIDINITTPDKPQTMILSVSATDINGKKLTKEITVYVTDESTPNLILTEPVNNQIPEVTGAGADIKFSGITLDKIESKFLEIVWVSDSAAQTEEAKKTLAEKWLNTITKENSHTTYAPAEDNKIKVTEGTGDYAGCKLLSVELIEDGKESSFLKYKFDFTLSLLNDFYEDQTKTKYLFARITRDDGVYSDSEYKLIGDDVVPEIVAIEPTGNMAIIDQDNDLYIKFKGTKTNGTEMNAEKYKLYFVDSDGIETEITGSVVDGVFVSEKISKTTIKNYADNNIVPKYRLCVEDKLGNKNSVTYQFIISSLPQIKAVTSSAPTNCKIGDEIDINVVFTKTVTLADVEKAKDEVKLKLKGIKNDKNGITADTVIYADYVSGSGSTTLIFKYIVKEGDVSTGVQVFNESGKGPILDTAASVPNITETIVHLTTLDNLNNLQEKRKDNPITIDGIRPKLVNNGIVIKAVGTDSSNKDSESGITYLKAGRGIQTVITVDEVVSVQGAPKFILKNGTEKVELTYQSISPDGKNITFEYVVKDTDENGGYSYSKSEYLDDASVIRDSYGNEFDTGSLTGDVDSKLVVDTKVPKKPVIIKPDSTNTPFEAGKYNSDVSFSITKDTTEVGLKTEYYDYLAATPAWTVYNTASVNVTKSASIVARATDYAGNVSEYSDTVNIEINSTFPNYTVECTNSDGNYKQGEVLEFKVYFSEPVSFAKDSTAYIELSSLDTDPKYTVTKAGDQDSHGTHAVLKAYTQNQNNVTEAVFTYTTDKYANFKLKIAKDAVHLTGFKDQYGNGQKAGVDVINKNSNISGVDYTRPNLYLDSVMPVITVMKPQGTESTQNGMKAYTNGKEIQLTFSEPVQVVSGKIYLRQKAGWAIPPMFTAEEFNKVLNAVKSADIDKDETNNLSGTEVLYMDGLEDGENLFGSLNGPAHDRYHGTAQYVGPYKKMTNGVDSSGNPDLSIKYVLDFGVDIWDSNNSTKQNFGLTYIPSDSTEYKTYHRISQKGNVHVVTPETVITTDTIRYVLEKAHYHERYMDVNSGYVSIDKDDERIVTLKFPLDILDREDLPVGREWELIIEQGAFMDKTGNEFGTRAFETVGEFMSAGVEKPVIRVDRYSYGLGIKQPKEIKDGNIVYETIDVNSISSSECLAGRGTTMPSANVGVKIDCETKNVEIRYVTGKVENENSDSLPKKGGADGGWTKKVTNWYWSTTNITIPTNIDESYKKGRQSALFLGGTGDYRKSCRQYIVATAGYENEDNVADLATEVIFQTVLQIKNPNHYDKNDSIATCGDGRQDISISGTTGDGGVPQMVPFPLREYSVGGAYMRRLYQNNHNYYWVSYEVLMDAVYTMYAFGAPTWNNNKTYGHYDFAVNKAKFRYGEFNRTDGMTSWPIQCNNNCGEYNSYEN